MNDWTDNWPSISGFYWFYGKRFANDTDNRLFMSRVHRKDNGDCIYICDGNFLYKSEGAEGVWKPIEKPELP